MSLSLSTISNDLEQLIEAREEVLAGGMCPDCLGTGAPFNPCIKCNSSGRKVDAAALDALDGAIRQYSTELLPNKVDAYWWLLKKIGKPDDKTGLITDAKREIKRLQGEIDRWDTLQQELRANVLAVMGERKVLEGTNGRKLRRQANGGVLAVDVVQPDLVPVGLQRVVIRMNRGDWLRALASDAPGLLEGAEIVATEPDKEAIRKVLESREPCPDCGGVDPKGEQEDNYFCGVCGGEGTIHCGVPGARLRERGESLRVSG